MVSTMPTSWSQTLTTALGMGPESWGTGEKHGMVDGAGGGAGESHAGEELVREDSLETDTWAEKAPPDLDLDGIPG